MSLNSSPAFRLRWDGGRAVSPPLLAGVCRGAAVDSRRGASGGAKLLDYQRQRQLWRRERLERRRRRDVCKLLHQLHRHGQPDRPSLR